MEYKINTKAELESFITSEWDQVNAYIKSMGEGKLLPIYSSCDIRESADKYAPVDLNIYPAGFNNICAQDLSVCGEAFREIIMQYHPGCRKVFIIPESHTKNSFYLENLYYLQKAITDAGFETYLVTLDPALIAEGDLQLETQSGKEISIYAGEILENKIFISSLKKSCCMAIMNNDQSNPLDINWNELKTTIQPSPKIGWFRRQKNSHFNFYEKVLTQFCQEFSIDPSLMQAKFKTVEGLDFSTKQGFEELAKQVDLLKQDLNEETTIFVKASQGTYGMGIMVVKSGEEVLNMNRKSRNKMDIGKNKIKFTSALIQEGVDTMIQFNDIPAEVTIYTAGGNSIGGFMRGNPNRSNSENLNSRGMVYQKFCLSEIQQNKDDKIKESVYSVIARLSTIAAAYEIEEVVEA